MRTIRTNRGAKGRRKKRAEKKRRLLEEEAKVEKEKARVKNSALFKEDFKARRRKRPRKEIRAENQKKVDKLLTAEEQINQFIEDWRKPDTRRWTIPEKKKAEKMEDAWDSGKEIKRPPLVCLQRKLNRTVKTDMLTFQPETYFSYNPSDKQREVGLDAVGEYWDNWTGKDLKREEQHKKEAAEYWEGFKQREAEEEFLGEDSSDSCAEEGTGYRIKMPWGRAGKLKSERNADKRRKMAMVKAAKAREEKRFLQELSLFDKYNKMITQHMLELGAKPKVPRPIGWRTANKKKYEAMMPMLLTPEEIENAKGSSLRRLAVQKDTLNELVNRLQVKRIIFPDAHKPPYPKKNKPTYSTFVKIGGAATGVRVENLLKTLTETD